MNIARRSFLSALVKGAGFITLAITSPSIIFAKWNKAAFAAENLADAISLKYPGLDIVDSAAVKLKAPEIAENGAVVPVSVKTDLPDVKSISLFIENNPAPLASTFNLNQESIADVSVRVRMGQSTKVHAIVESGGKLHRKSQEVKVTIGGCGG